MVNWIGRPSGYWMATGDPRLPSRLASVILRHKSRLHHIGPGRALAGQRIILLTAGRDVRVLHVDRRLIRHLTLYPTRDYQPLTAGPATTYPA